MPGDGGAYFLTRVVGFARALELVLTGRVITAEEALTIGLVHEVSPADQLMHVACERAEAIARLPPMAVQLTKRAAYRSYHADQATALELAATYQGIVQNLDDHLRAISGD